MTAADDARADYRDVFDKDPEPWRGPLGALRLTLAGDAPWTLERARGECEELVRVLNEVEVTDEQVEAAARAVFAVAPLIYKAGDWVEKDWDAGWLDEETRDIWRAYARAALEAARGADRG